MYDIDRRHFNAILAGVCLAGTTATVGAETLLAASPAVSAGLPTKHDVRLIPVFKADRVWNGVTTTRDGRVFISYSSADRPGVQIEELSPNGVGRAYPDEAWNAWQPGHDPKDAFVRVNALRIGPEGALWVIDAGPPGSASQQSLAALVSFASTLLRTGRRASIRSPMRSTRQATSTTSASTADGCTSPMLGRQA